MINNDIIARVGRRDMDKTIYNKYVLWRTRFIDVILCLGTIVILLNVYECSLRGKPIKVVSNITSLFDSNLQDEFIYDDLRKAITRVCN
jgi:hypothetical protein